MKPCRRLEPNYGQAGRPGVACRAVANAETARKAVPTTNKSEEILPDKITPKLTITTIPQGPSFIGKGQLVFSQ